MENERIIIDSDYYLFAGPTPDDIDDLILHLNDEGVYNGLLKMPFPYTKADAEFYLKGFEFRKQQFGRPMNWQLRTKEGKLIGGISLQGHYGKDSHRDEIGYWLGRAYWNKGIMTKVLPAFSKFVAIHYGIIRLEATIFEYNAASIKVVEKCGFNYEGTLKKAYFKDGKYIDGKLYALVK
ncbi:GNAT family N-acetyltransferase [soil metagenome]